MIINNFISVQLGLSRVPPTSTSQLVPDSLEKYGKISHLSLTITWSTSELCDNSSAIIDFDPI